MNAESTRRRPAITTHPIDHQQHLLSLASRAAAGSPAPSWSAEQILQHVTTAERNYREKIKAWLGAAVAARAAGGDAT